MSDLAGNSAAAERPSHQTSNPAATRTLQLTWPFGKTLVDTIGVLFVTLSVIELIARTHALDSTLTPSVTDSIYFDVKLAQAERLKMQTGAIDCVVVGDSLAMIGIDPVALRDAYARETGEDLLCYNFALAGLGASQYSTLARLTTETLDPHVIIIGINIIDFYAAGDQLEVSDITFEGPWARYRLGQFNAEGWLLDHAVLTRYYRGAGVKDDPYRLAQMADGVHHLLNPYGQLIPPRRYNVAPVDPQALTASFPPFAPPSEALASLEGLRALTDQGRTVILLEMPIPPEYEEYFNQRQQRDYDQFLRTLRDLGEATNAVVILSHNLELPPEAWGPDYQHMNIKGGSLFSIWLADQIAGETHPQTR
jgi:hypothetical protein